MNHRDNPTTTTELPSTLLPYFADGNLDRAWDFVLRDKNSVDRIAESCFEYENAAMKAKELITKHGLSELFPDFRDESYRDRIQFTSAEEIRRLNDLSDEDLHDEVEEFMNEYTDLEKGTVEYEKATWLRIYTTKRTGGCMMDLVMMLVFGFACLLPVRIHIGGEEYVEGEAIFTMGTSEMATTGMMNRHICQGMSTRHYGDRNNNNHPIPFDGSLIISPTHTIMLYTNAGGQNSDSIDDDDNIYAGRTIAIDGKDRIIRRVHENLICKKPDANTSELVGYEIRLDRHTFAHHRYLLIYAAACGIGTNSLEYILKELRSTAANANMERDKVNPDEQCDGDHCFHRLMWISNSIYFCLLMDHTSNMCNSINRIKAGDWNYTLTLREYFGGN